MLILPGNLNTIKINMNFIQHKLVFFRFSLALIGLSTAALLIWGLRPGISFTGGSWLEVKFETEEVVKQEQIKQAGENVFNIQEIQTTAENQFILKGDQISLEEKQQVMQGLEQLGEVQEIKFEMVGPALDADLVYKTGSAVLLICIIVIGYIWYQFKDLKYGVCAVLAMLHDTVILLGSFSLLGYLFDARIDTLFIAAVLTTLAFSLHDTVVIYDRIRELAVEKKNLKLVQSANLVIWETLVRSINNSLTIIFMLLALLLLGGESLRWFAAALLIGALAATYSSTFVAVPLLVYWEGVKSKRG